MVRPIAACLCTASWAREFNVTVPGLGELIGTDVVPELSAPRYEGVAQFYAIPFGKPPVGNLRFQPPQPHGAWESPRDATQHGAACMQVMPQKHAPGISEDCLFLNVATPQRALGTRKLLPVMFWIHGGAYVWGASSDYPIDSLVAGSNHSVVVVATNYRLNAFGFLGGGKVQAHTSDGSSGNFGIQDQRMAMAWIRDHVGALGGDAAEVTIFGQSAGGNSVMNHLTQTSSFSLYRRAIVESGTYTQGSISMSEADVEFDEILAFAGCLTIKCLASKHAWRLLPSPTGVAITSPVIDGVSLSASPWELVRQGQYNRDADIMIGSVRDEAAFITDVLPKRIDALEFDIAAEAVLAVFAPRAKLSDVKKVLDPSVYPYPSDLGGRSQKWWELTRLGTDTVPGLGACGTRSFARDLLAAGSKNVYTYIFSKPHFSKPVVKHADEIHFVFGDTQRMSTPADSELALALSSYWSSFAVTGNPNHEGLPHWPQYTADSDISMRFDDAPSMGGIHQQQGLRKAACDYWDSVENFDSTTASFWTAVMTGSSCTVLVQALNATCGQFCQCDVLV